MSISSETAFPPTIINKYIQAELEHFGILSGSEQMNPIFPTTPTTIDEVYKNYIGAPNIDDPLLIQFERLVRFRPTTFYRHKREQLVLYLYCNTLSKVLDASRIILEALDREDAAAQDLNKWAASAGLSNHNIMFHSLRVFQIDESRDILELASARTSAVNKIIIEYDYHRVPVAGDPVSERYN